ncbi:MAG TPA: hypothetical protein VE377_24390 [Candidatus Dormibacteraeota bacterium]|nr:hypothetical protein [Candidatus Dormibacteraeota bacterium]
MLQTTIRDGSSWRRCWHALIVILAICGLTVSLATRTFRLEISQKVSVASDSVQPMRQHLDRDAVQWAPPTPVFSILQAPAFYPQVAPAAPRLRSVPIDKSLSNRPPPSC